MDRRVPLIAPLAAAVLLLIAQSAGAGWDDSTRLQATVSIGDWEPLLAGGCMHGCHCCQYNLTLDGDTAVFEYEGCEGRVHLALIVEGDVSVPTAVYAPVVVEGGVLVEAGVYGPLPGPPGGCHHGCGYCRGQSAAILYPGSWAIAYAVVEVDGSGVLIVRVPNSPLSP